MKREGYTLTDYADYYDFSHGKWSSRSGNGIRRIIPHHMAGNLTETQFYNIIHGGRQMSPTVAVFTDGTVWAYVPEEFRPWTTGGWDADCCALTLEIANDGGAESGWHISDKAYNTAVAICAEWCKRYGIDPVYTYRGSGLNMHRDWASTACPGDYLYQKITSGQMTADIRKAMNAVEVLFSAGRPEGGELRLTLADAKTVTQPLHHGAGNKDAALESVVYCVADLPCDCGEEIV